ncbi:MAG: guanylyl cyclase [Deltaproteobacteria bacterium]|nr:guanylyl cyclase [Deltaproteobacteria bacterium]
MTGEEIRRKLSVVFHADVMGYSRLMEDNHEATLHTLTEYRQIFSSIIEAHQGRVVSYPGDAVLAEFDSAVEAVQGAVEIQRKIAERNSGLTESRKMFFRIGLNIGDVLEKDNDLFGDGVNIAARLESLAEGGGVLISGTVYDQVSNRLDFEYEYLGEQSVKNITKPIRAYRVEMDPGVTVAAGAKKKAGKKRWRPVAIAVMAVVVFFATVFVILKFYPSSSTSPTGQTAKNQESAAPLSDKPSIAVLPFLNMSNDPEQEYFADGITEDLITDLSKISGLFVIARTSTFSYKGKQVAIQQIARELGVRYVLEGSIRKVGDKVRINAQLIEAASGHHLWAERYDGDMSDIFALEEKINQKIVSALAVTLTAGEKQQVAFKETDNIEAYDAFLKGSEHFVRFTAEDFSQALIFFKQAVELDPDYSRAYAALAYLYWRGAEWNWHEKLGVGQAEARILARTYQQKAMKNPTSYAHIVASDIQLYQRLHDEAIAEAERALVLEPNDPLVHAHMALVLMYVGRPAEAIDHINTAMRLDPHYTGLYLLGMGTARFCMGQLEEAVALLERSRSHTPGLRWASAILTVAYARLDRNQEAREALGKLIPDLENLTPDEEKKILKYVMSYVPFKDLKTSDDFAAGLIKAGLPGQASDYYRITRENRLTEQEIKDLTFGRKMLTVDPGTGNKIDIYIAPDGRPPSRSSISGSWTMVRPTSRTA